MKKRYTKEEDEIIIESVKKYPDNIRFGFKIAVKLLKDRPISSVHYRYYFVLKPNNLILTVGSSKGFTANNVKNRISTKDKNFQPNLLPFQFVTKQILDLSFEDRKKVLNFFK